MKNQVSGTHLFYGTFLVFTVQEPVDQGEIFLPDTAGKKPCGTDLHESGREEMHQEAAYKLLRGKGHDLYGIRSSLILFIPESNTLFIKGFNPAVGNRGAVGISRKVVDSIIRSLSLRACRYRGQGADLHVPVSLIAGIQKFLPGIRVPIFQRIIEIFKLAGIPELLQAVKKLPSIERGKRLHREEELSRRAALELLFVRGKASAGYQHVKMIME